MSEQDRTLLMATAVTEANGLTTTLHLLRADRIKQAMEQLETQLDCSVVELNQLLQEVSEQDRKAIMETLQSIRGYRLLYPRREEVNIDWMKDRLVADVRETQKQAQSILENIKVE